MGDFAYFTTNFAPKIGRARFSGIALPECGRYLKRTHVWMDLSLLCQLRHHLIKTIWCRQKVMTSYVVQCLRLQRRGKSTFAAKELKL